MELSQLGLKFDENTLAETNGFTLHITDEKDLAGLPEGAVEMAAMTAKKKNWKAGCSLCMPPVTFLL